MKRQHITANGLIIIVIMTALPAGGCCRTPKLNPLNSKDRVVTISAVNPGNSNPCEVDFPVTLLKKNKNHTIKWVAEDHDYWIVFDPNGAFTSPIGSIGTHKIKVSPGSPMGPYPIALTPPPSTPPPSSVYFTYWIYDKDPDTVPPSQACKKSSDERDTGLNVKP